jgi:hypothetical protein
MIDMAQCERGFYSVPKRAFKYHLVNESTGELVAVYDERPRLRKLANDFPDFWDYYKLVIEEA